MSDNKKFYTLETWLEDHEDVSLYDNVHIFDINDNEIDIDKYDEATQEIIMQSEVISHDEERDGYFVTHTLILDISKEKIK